MSFILRQIAKRYGAPDIIRERPIAAAQPVIGRGSDCDIQLTDLAVSLRHAVLRPGGPGRVTVEALGPEHFEAGGKFVSRAELIVADSPSIGFGNHVLTLSDKDGDIIVTTTAREDAAATLAAGEQKAAFSLKSALFSQRQAAWVTAIVILLACMAIPVTEFLIDHNRHPVMSADVEKQWSSGPLSPGHHFLEKNCAACHQSAFVPVRDTACLSCHQAGLSKDASAHLAAVERKNGSPFAPQPAGDHAPYDRLWQATPPDPNTARRVKQWVANSFGHPTNRCASCHTEHVGTGAGESGKAQAPVTPAEITRNDCKDCHTGLKQRLADTKLGDVPDWGHHPDFRPLIATAFTAQGKPLLQDVALTDKPQQQTGLVFSHRQHLAANGSVARMAINLGSTQGYGGALACASCHRPTADNKGFQPIEMTRDCSACHSLAFASKNGVPQMLKHGDVAAVVAQLKAYYTQEDGAAGNEARPVFGSLAHDGGQDALVSDRVRRVFAAGGSCDGCHAITKPSTPGSLDFKVAPVNLVERHLLHGAFDHDIPAHHQDSNGKATCSDCHAAEKSDHTQDVLLPHISDCAACHGKSKQQAVMAAAADCAECHSFHDTGRQGVILAAKQVLKP